MTKKGGLKCGIFLSYLLTSAEMDVWLASDLQIWQGCTKKPHFILRFKNQWFWRRHEPRWKLRHWYFIPPYQVIRFGDWGLWVGNLTTPDTTLASINEQTVPSWPTNICVQNSRFSEHLSECLKILSGFYCTVGQAYRPGTKRCVSGHCGGHKW